MWREVWSQNIVESMDVRSQKNDADLKKIDVWSRKKVKNDISGKWSGRHPITNKSGKIQKKQRKLWSDSCGAWRLRG